LLIDKNAILQAFEELGEYERADEARQGLPDRLDTDEHRHLFRRLGIEPQDLFSNAPRRPTDQR
jgi:hypothetical protein